MTIARDARYALAVLVGKVDRSDPEIPARLAIMKARHLGQNDLCDLIDRAMLAHASALVRAPNVADRSYLRAVATGGVNLHDEGVFDRLVPIYNRCKGDPSVMALFALATDAFAGAALDDAAAILNRGTSSRAIKRARRVQDE